MINLSDLSDEIIHDSLLLLLFFIKTHGKNNYDSIGIMVLNGKINLNINQSQSQFVQPKNIMKNLMSFLDKNTKPSKSNLQLHKTFLKSSKSEVFFVKKHKKSTSPDLKKPQVSKNDQRITIYTDSTGFVLQSYILGYGLKCDCYVTQTAPKKNIKGLKLESVQPRQQLPKKKAKLQITLTKQHITTIKNGVQHIFSLPQQSKQNFLKVVLSQNWEAQMFTIPNKKTKISQFESLSISQKDIDCVYPLKNILQADELRKTKLIKSQSRIKISWGSAQKQAQEDSHNNLNKSEIISFGSQKVLGELSRSTIIETTRQFQRSPFLKKSLNECDQTRDSQQQQHTQERVYPLTEKKGKLNEVKSLKNIHIDLSQWNYTPIIKQGIKSPCRQTNFQYRILGDQQRGEKGRFFK